MMWYSIKLSAPDNKIGYGVVFQMTLQCVLKNVIIMVLLSGHHMANLDLKMFTVRYGLHFTYVLQRTYVMLNKGNRMSEAV